MQIKVDYLSFSVPARFFFEAGDLDDENKAHEIVTEFLGSWWAPIAAAECWERYPDKGFYHTRLFHADSKIMVFIGNVNRHVHIECGGQALDYIRTLGFYEELMKRVGTRASRVDFAVDFESECPVREFIVNNDRKAFKAGGDVFSEDGDTTYIGSWKGERFARVYRYHKPHPRSHLLRAEVVLRKKYAKQAMTIWAEKGELQAALAAHAAFKWVHPLWKPAEATESRIKSERSDKQEAGAVRWVMGDVVSAVIRMHNDGLIDATEWFHKLIAPKLLK